MAGQRGDLLLQLPRPRLAGEAFGVQWLHLYQVHFPVLTMLSVHKGYPLSSTGHYILCSDLPAAMAR
jgi:hypothetical protein